MLKVAINGYLGTMGKVAAKEIQKDTEMILTAGIDTKYIEKDSNGITVYDDILKIEDDIDLIIDFSHPSSLDSILNFATDKGIPLVIGTTGLNGKDMEKIESACKKTAIFYSANMSLGINLLLSLVKQAAKILGGNFDIEIIEKHHNKKIDAPSGTAYMIADAINSSLNDSRHFIYGRYGKLAKRAKNEIGIHAIRGGSIVGDHTVIFAGPDELVQINHSATSKRIFAQGALVAGKFIVNKSNGLYNMDDLINNE